MFNIDFGYGCIALNNGLTKSCVFPYLHRLGAEHVVNNFLLVLKVTSLIMTSATSETNGCAFCYSTENIMLLGEYIM